MLKFWSLFLACGLIAQGAFCACEKGQEQAVLRPACAAQKDDMFARLLNQESLPLEKPKTLPTLLVFVSFSMPKQTLKDLAQQARQVGGALVVRGLKGNSFKETALTLQDIGEGVLIDPTLFERFSIQVVPTFIRAKEIPHGETSMPAHDRLTGNVTLPYVLGQFAKDGQVPGADLLLQKLERPA